MATKSPKSRLAVLIDAENVPARIAAPLFREVTTLGEAHVRRIYGDFSTPGLKAWTGCLAPHAIVAQQTFAHKAGKNGSDIALVIDAMDLLLSGRFDGFCLVSSDSDFTRLALRVREQGLSFFGFGEAEPPEAFRQACTRFILLKDHLPAKPSKAAGTKAPSKQDASPAPKAASADRPPTPQPAAVVPARELKPIEEAQDIIRFAIEQTNVSDSGWCRLAEVGKAIREQHPKFDPRDYGQWKKLSDLLAKSGQFEMRDENGHISVRSVLTDMIKVVADG